MKGQRLQVVDKFTDLGNTLSRVVHIDNEVNARIAKACAAFGRLRGSIWDRSGIRFDTKLKVYISVVLPTLLYVCETSRKHAYIILTPLNPTFKKFKLGFTGVYIIFLISAQNIDCGYSLEPPRQGGSNEHPQSMF